MSAHLHNELDKTIGELIGQFSDQSFREFSRSSMLSVIDEHWKDQIEDLDTLRGGIHLRGFAQKNPVQEYGRESMEMFVAMVESIKESFSLQLISTLKEVISRSGKEIGEDQVLAFREELESEQEIEQETERTGIKYVTHLYRQEKIKRENAI